MTQNENTHSQLISTLEEFARKGQIEKLVQAIKSIRYAKTPRQYRFPLAQLARRAGLPLLSLQIMRPVVFPKFKLKEPLRVHEKLIYANTLSFLGSYDEAKFLLKTINGENAPEVYLNLAFLQIFQWNYKDAIPLLNKYIKSASLSDYSRLIGKVNLAAAMVEENKNHRIDNLLNEILDETQSGEHWLLHSNALEIKSQLNINFGNYKYALSILQEAKKFMPLNSQSLYFRMIEKWEAVAECLLNPKSKIKQKNLLLLRKKCLNEQHWEIVRDIDFFYGLILKSNFVLSNTLSGSPYLNFRKRAKVFLKNSSSQFSTSNWRFDTLSLNFLDKPEIPMKTISMDFRNLNDPANRLLAKNKLCSKLMEILIHDGYKPIMTGSLFRLLYPDESFDPIHSHRRIQNLIFRLRRIISYNKWNLEIKSIEYGYQLVSYSPTSIKKHKTKRSLKNDYLNILRTSLKGRSFTSQLAATQMGLSLSASKRILYWAVEKGVLNKIGRGRSVRYKFSNHKDLPSVLLDVA